MTLSVLILEDSKTQATVISKMFERAGFVVTCVPTEDEALSLLKSQSFQLLVLDVFVDGRNTLDDLGLFRELAQGVPIAIMTAGQMANPESGADALNKARRQRVMFLLPKPFYYDDVKQICEDISGFWAHREATALAS
jgi:CheY-like chemotaxis protein